MQRKALQKINEKLRFSNQAYELVPFPEKRTDHIKKQSSLPTFSRQKIVVSLLTVISRCNYFNILCLSPSPSSQDDDLG